MKLYLFVFVLTASNMHAQDGYIADLNGTDISYTTNLNITDMSYTGYNETGASNAGFNDSGFNDTGFKDTGLNDTSYAGFNDTVINDTSGSYTGFNDTGFNDTGLNDASYAGFNDTVLNDTSVSYARFNEAGFNDNGFKDTGLNDTSYAGFNDTVLNDTSGSYAGFNDTVFNETGFNDTGLNDTSYAGFSDTGFNDTSGSYAGFNDTGLNDTGGSNAGFNDTGFNDTTTDASEAKLNNMDVIDIVSYSDLTDIFSIASNAYHDKQTLIPMQYSNQTMNVTLDMFLASLNSFDELGGYLEISGYLNVRWTATSVARSTANISVLLTSPAIWKPPLLFVNSIKGTAEIGDTTSKVRCNLMSWKCVWKPWIVLRGACTPDATFYPFDRQECAFKIAAWGHTKDELKLRYTKSEWNLELFEENAEWTIEGTSSENYNQHNVSFVEFKIKLKRIPMYYVINLIAPVALLALVNIGVFILPVESEERVGFSMTCFLSFVFLLTSIMWFIPSSSANVAYLCYYTFIMMVFSCGMSLATVITLWIHFKSENSNNKVPFVLYGLVYMLKCQCFCFDTSQSGTESPDQPSLPANNVSNGVEDDVRFKVSWKDVASIMDNFFTLGFLGAQIFYSVAYLLPIILNE